MVEIIDAEKDYVVARGLAEESSEEIRKSIKEVPHKKCGHKDVVVHRDNLAIV